MPKSVSGGGGLQPASQSVLAVARLPRKVSRDIALIPDRDQLAALADELGVTALRKVSLRGSLSPVGKSDWQLDAMLGATIVQPCGVTLAPVTTRVDEPVERIWRAEPRHAAPAEDGDVEIEMPEDVREEPLGRVIDLGAVLTEALALAIPPWPRAPGAELGEAVFAEPGLTPMRDQDARPFAGLAGLRDRLQGGENDEESGDGNASRNDDGNTGENDA